MVTIGVICAMDSEFDLIREALSHGEIQTAGRCEFLSAERAGKRVVAATCGVGKVNAAVCAQTMALIYEPELIINSGVSGALSPELRVGDVVIGTDVVQHDVDTTALGDEPGFVSTVDRLSFPLDNFASTAIAAAAEELGIRAVRGRIASGEQFVASTERKEEIVRLFSAVTCEMEAGAIAHVCFLNRIPCAVIRSISDGGNEEAPMSYEEFLPLAAKNSSELTLAYLKSLQNL